MTRWSAMVLVLAALAAPGSRAEQTGRLGLPWDWSHRHVLWSNAVTAEEALAQGRYAQWLRDAHDPRFLSQVVRRMDKAGDAVAKAGKPNPWKRPAPPIHRDWSVLAGGSGGVGNAGVFPAKYNFDISAAPSCSGDFLVFTTGSPAATSTASANASFNGNVTGNFGNNQAVTLNNNGRTLVLTSATGLNTGFNFDTLPTGNTAAALATKAANLAAAINRNGAVAGVTASSSAGVVTVRAATAGTAGNAITWTESLGGFARASNTMSGGAGVSGQPTIIAYNQIYSSCGASGYPSLMWSYNTGDGATAQTSPILSLDGKQAAFIQSSGAGAASLVVLKWTASSPGTLDVPVAPTSVSAASYRACSAPCMTVIPLAGGADDTNSSPYYDYEADQLWVGDDNGALHRLAGIFSGTPTESGSPWPVTVVAGRILSSPVYDQVQNMVFVGSAREAGATPTGGRLHSVSNANAAVSSSSLLSGSVGASGSTGVSDAPMLDALAKRVYAFVYTDTSTGAAGCSNVACNAIFQFATDSALSGQALKSVHVGRGDRLSILYGGTFDDAYYASADFTNPTGSLYVCGSQGNEGRRPTLWKIPITNNTLGAPVIGPNLVGANLAVATGHCSPITQVVNGSSEFLFASVPASGNEVSCAGACIYAWDLNSIGPWSASVTTTAGLAAPGGTGGIIIDNVSAVGGASQVYFMTQGSTAGFGSVVQASQAGLN